jgi:TP53 regulating kinase and related kinases
MVDTKNIIGKGAEAVLYNLDTLNNNILVKDRIQKKYRICEIDEELRKTRTRREAKVLDKLKLNKFPAPNLEYTDNKSIIHMQFLVGEKLSVILNEINYLQVSKEIGKLIGKLHNLDIIHGDLTTSNIIYNLKEKQAYFIDFGLSFFSTKVEDKAVDLHLIKQALESKHYEIYDLCFENLIKEYGKIMKESKNVLKRLELVEKRGRNRTKLQKSK